MILLLGPMADQALANVCARLAARNADLMLVHPEAGENDWNVTWSTEAGRVGDRVRIGKRTVPLGDITSVYLRGVGNRSGATVRERMLSASLWELVDGLPALVVNRRRASSTNTSKPYQQRLIAEYGFRVPKTLVTTVPEEALAFYESCHGCVIYKSVSGERSIVRPLTSADLGRLDQIKCCPVQLQEMVPGVDIRVHTVGDRLFATEVTSDTADYRYARRDNGQRTMRAIELRPELDTRCLALAKGLGLVMSGIDLRRTPDGDYVCFEVNTSPGFMFFESCTGQRIGDAVADLLRAGRA